MMEEQKPWFFLLPHAARIVGEELVHEAFERFVQDATERYGERAELRNGYAFVYLRRFLKEWQETKGLEA